MSFTCRTFEPGDRDPVYRLFRESVWDFMLQRGIVTADDEYDVDEYFRQQRGQYLHLEDTACEDWVAVNEEDRLLGWARSIERDNHLQLTHFFVDPGAQEQGIGRALLERAFPLSRGSQRSIIATTDTRALSLYLRHGVNFQGMAFSFFGEPKLREIASDLELVQAEASTNTLDQVIAIEAEVLGYRRPVDIEFFMQQQPTYLFYRDGRAVAYAFGCNGSSAGPAAALDPAHLPILLNQIERSAVEHQAQTLWLTIPAAAHPAVDWALSCGYQIDPFYEVLLARFPSMQFDRYIMTQSAFIW